MSLNKANVSRVLKWFKRHPSLWNKGRMCHNGTVCMLGGALCVKHRMSPTQLASYMEKHGNFSEEAANFLGLNANDVVRINDFSKNTDDFLQRAKNKWSVNI